MLLSKKNRRGIDVVTAHSSIIPAFRQSVPRWKLVVVPRAIILALFPLLGFMFQSEGFDLYHHSTSYYFQHPINRGYLLGDLIIVPRYLLLSDILQFSGMSGIPLGWVILVLCTYPAYMIGLSGQFRNFQYTAFGGLVYFAVFFLSLFYSGASLVLLWLLAYFIMKKPVFLFGLAFHPLGLLFSGLFLIFSLKIGILFRIGLFAVIYVGFCYLKTKFNFPAGYADTQTSFKISGETIRLLAEFSFEKKKNEIVGFLSLAVFIHFFLPKKHKALGRVTMKSRNAMVMKVIFFCGVLSMSTILTIKSAGKSPLIAYILTLQAPPPIYVTWLDFGVRDYDGTFTQLLYLRVE